MFALADLIVMNAIEDGLENLRNNPSHLEFILGKFEDTAFMRKLHGSAYIRQCKELVLQNRIFVKPYYVLDMNKLPSVAVIAQYQEDMLVLGDYGSDQQTAIIPPVLLTEVQGIAWEESGFGLEIANVTKVTNVSGDAKVTDLLYSGAYLKQNEFVTRINYILPGLSGHTAIIFCNDTLPRNTLLNWEVVTASTSKIATIHSSGNQGSVAIDLKSSGDIETHKLLALVIRYCLRRGRYLMDQNGLQISTSSQNFPTAFDEEQGIFQTVFNLQGKIWDSWIETESINGRYENLTMCAEPPLTNTEAIKVRGFII